MLKIYYRIFVAATTIILFGELSVAASDRCKTLEQIDQCGAIISFLENRQVRTPTNDAEVTDICGKARTGIACLREHFTECTTGIVRDVTLSVLRNLEAKHLDFRCDSAAHRTEFLRHIQCFVDETKIEIIRQCVDRYLVILERLANEKSPTRVGGICCAWFHLHDCIVNNIRRLCSGESGDYFSEMIMEVHGDIMQNLCGSITSVQTCEAQYDSAALAKVKNVFETQDVAVIKNHRYQTGFPTFIKLMEA